MSASSIHDEWPELSYPEWEATQKTLQLYTQIAGKTRLCLNNPKPQWVGASLLLTARGLTTTPMPHGAESVEVVFDFYDDSISINTSGGGSGKIALVPAKCVADVYEQYMNILSDLGVHVEIWTKPQEVDDATPLDQDRHHCTYDPEHARRFFRVLTAVANVFEEWHSRFFGRTSVQFWWGSFDLSVLAFSGKQSAPPPGANYIMRYDLDAEHLACGFWPGGDASPEPMLYAYMYPQPPGCESAQIKPAAASWVKDLGEWVLPYQEVRRSANPRLEILEFLASAYDVAGSLGGWDLESFAYSPPPVRTRRIEAVSPR